MAATELGSEKYIRLTTFTKDGRPKPTPVWIADLGDGTLGFTTASSSWKVRRIRATPKVVLQPSDSRGTIRPGSEPVEATAVVQDGDDFVAVRDRVSKKYGIQYRAISLWGSLARLVGKGSGTDCAVVISPDD
jgi:PPOX class probable F420-dependent enzyme